MQHHSVFGSPGCGHMHSKKDLAFGFPKAFSFPIHRDLTQDKADSSMVLSRKDVYRDKAQFIYEIADQNYEKPIIRRALPFLSNHLSKEEGVISMSLALNSELVPSIQIRYASPMTSERLWILKHYAGMHYLLWMR